MATRPLVLFDADCGFCTRCARALPGKLFRARVDEQALQQADLASLGLEHEAVVDLMHVVRADGSIAIGHHAWAEILRHSRQPWPIIGRVLGSRPLEPLASRVYAWVAHNREKMPGGTPACSLADRPMPSTTDSAATPTSPRPAST